MLHELARLAVDGEVDRGVEIGVAEVHDEVLMMLHIDDELDMVRVRLLLDHAVDRLHAVEVADEALGLLAHVGVDRFGDLEMLALDVDLHGSPFRSMAARTSGRANLV